ncbi:MAG TPA: discoidin domain-containing protein [Baekduia sp.]|uniref:discoidin domain-containing protein n=1 Tax=Baekduia sp. TaxID=2600305 RepID=UPI002C2F68BF|nr:discoidin domain-containing protein [Baekduia sp.]HMJ36159.1 discoidin domain-containing protein [Baekduia sp.]
MPMSPRTTVTALLLAAAAALAATAPAGAVTSHGLNGYVTDADTGLGLNGSSVTWNGTTSPAPQVTTDGTGRFLFTGLDPGTTGSLAVVGPAGWDRKSVGGVTLPATDLGTQNVPLHRDWATPAGGASASANDGSVPGCASAAAVDNDRATGWSASATRPADDPPALTVTLPQTIDVRQLVLDPTSACDHAAGAALGRYRVQTSGDGASWATALEGELGADARGAATMLSPAVNAGGVRYVRLQLLSAQDPASPTIDVRELQVFGVGPNQPPAGTVSAGAERNYIKGIVRLRASFTDADSSILRYLWDFDGDGRYDQATNGPAVAHVWSGPGVYHVTVGARDFRGALGTASLDVRITDPSALVEAVPQRKPLITFDPPLGIDLPTRIACASKCTFTAKMVLTARTAKRIHAKRRTAMTFKRSTVAAGLGSWTLTLPNATVKLLRKAKLKTVTVRLTASAVDRQKRRTTVHRWVKFR